MQFTQLDDVCSLRKTSWTKMLPYQLREFRSIAVSRMLE
jgi:hypothetical protein